MAYNSKSFSQLLVGQNLRAPSVNCFLSFDVEVAGVVSALCRCRVVTDGGHLLSALVGSLDPSSAPAAAQACAVKVKERLTGVRNWVNEGHEDKRRNDEVEG